MQLNVYAGEDEDQVVVNRVKELSDDTRVSASSLVLACVHACIDDLEKQVPTNRVVKLNKKEITV